MLELHHSLFSTCSQKVRLCLAEKGLAYESRLVSFARGDHVTPEYLALNPNGVAPTLVHNGAPVIDSSVICEYLNEIWPQPPLMPATALERARVRAWMRYLEEVATTAIRPPSFNALFSKHLATMDRAAFDAHADRLPIRKHFYKTMENGRFSDAEYAASLERLDQTIARAEAALADHPWIAGAAFTLADILLIPTAVRMEDLGLATRWAQAPRFTQWLERAQQRPSFDIAYPNGARIRPDTFSFAMSEPEDAPA